MRKLHLYPASHYEEMVWPEEIDSLSLETPALDFFTDFKSNRPLVIESSVSAIEVQKLMKKAHVRLKFVINPQYQFLGVVSTDDLVDRLIVQKTSEGFKREEIAVTELMRPKKNLSTLDYNELSRATIGDVIIALKDSGQQHCLVVDKDSNKIGSS
ncbi:CBS domain-containing protein [Saccharospirillum impatiens]|uniref:CBS domain-containing protein n=1 Tax=Saccharospirillum impatiens TaxID=169438 RepID=UPI0004176951|nr:CBS domain-containing protein [Saccharospirillum impatiens]